MTDLDYPAGDVLDALHRKRTQRPANADDGSVLTMNFGLLNRVIAEIERLRSLAVAVTDGPDLAAIRGRLDSGEYTLDERGLLVRVDADVRQAREIA